MVQVYEGDRPYIFVSYAHADGAAMPIIRALAEEGYRVWYDDGIQAGSSFPDYIADRLHDCSCVLMLVSRTSLTSGWCRSEVEYALDLGRPVLPVYLEDVELPRALRMRLGSVQALYWHAYATDEAFYKKLFSIRLLDSSLTDEGKQARGVKPRVPRSESAASQSGTVQRTSISNEERDSSSVQDVEQEAFLANYSWGELKLLSKAIAHAANDAEGFKIARYYRLVDSDGRLRGDIKPLVLTDGSPASVRIIGFRHDKRDNDSNAGITFEFTGMSAAHRMNARWTNMGGWMQSDMRVWLNSDFIAMLPSELAASIVEVKKGTNNRGRVSKDDTSAVTTSLDKLWLLSMSEVYGELSTQRDNVPWSPAIYDAEGVQYQLYADRGVTTISCTACAKEGAYSSWWLRSPLANSSHSFYRVLDDGRWVGCYATDDMDVSPCFCL